MLCLSMHWYSYCKFTIIVTKKGPLTSFHTDVIAYTIADAIVLTNDDGTLIPKDLVYLNIWRHLHAESEKYKNCIVIAITLRIDNPISPENRIISSLDDIVDSIIECQNFSSKNENIYLEPTRSRPVGRRNRLRPTNTYQKFSKQC